MSCCSVRFVFVSNWESMTEYASTIPTKRGDSIVRDSVHLDSAVCGSCRTSEDEKIIISREWFCRSRLYFLPWCRGLHGIVEGFRGIVDNVIQSPTAHRNGHRPHHTPKPTPPKNQKQPSQNLRGLLFFVPTLHQCRESCQS